MIIITIERTMWFICARKSRNKTTSNSKFKMHIKLRMRERRVRYALNSMWKFHVITYSSFVKKSQKRICNRKSWQFHCLSLVSKWIEIVKSIQNLKHFPRGESRHEIYMGFDLEEIEWKKNARTKTGTFQIIEIHRVKNVLNPVWI